MPGALDGIRVIEWAAWQQGPAIGMMLGDMGAEVIKVERPHTGDLVRGTQTIGGGVYVMTPQGRSLFFENNNRNKKSMTVDVGTSQGKEIMHRLVESADVFITNFRRPTVEALKMDYESLRKYNEKIIYLACFGLGPQGPDADTPVQDFTLQARAGMLLAQRSDDEVPLAQVGLGDQIGGTHAVIGVLGALLSRERTGIGQKIESSALGGLIALQATNIGICWATGENLRPINRKRPFNPLYNDFLAADKRWIVLGLGAASDRYWPNLCKCLGAEELIDDPRFSTSKAREENTVELTEILDRIFATQPSGYWLDKFRPAGILSSVVNRHLDLLNDPQVTENNYVIEYDHPVLGKMKTIGFPVNFTKTPSEIRTCAPELGQHTEEVLTELLGYSWEDVTRMKDEGAIG